MSRNDGGPAFPRYIAREQYEDSGTRTVLDSYGGMSLRDDFAGQALIGEIVTTCSDLTPQAAHDLVESAIDAGQSPIDRIAANAYKFADAMIAAREAK